MLQFSCRFACYHVIVSQTAYQKTWILTQHQANAPTLTRFSVFKHTPKLIIFGTHNLRTRTYNTESGAGCKSVCTRLLSATSVSWDSVSSTAGQVCFRTSSTTQWQVRLRACVKAKGRHFWAPSALKPALFRATLQATAQQTNKRFFSEPTTISRRNMHYFRYAVWETITW